MVIIIDNYGVDIGQHNKSFRISLEENQRTLSPYKVTAFHILKPATISTSAVLLAAEFEIPILFFDNKGRVKARLWQARYGSHATIRQHQVVFTERPEALNWVLEWLRLKLEGQLSVLKYCTNRVKSCAPQLKDASKEMESVFKEIDHSETTKERLMLAEAHISRHYWKVLSIAMDNYAPFSGRSRQPATDEFNSLINYGYGMLYAKVETAAMTAGLDPLAGIMHAEEYNRPALVFDTIEPFRPWIDRLVVELAMEGILKTGFFVNRAEGLWLSKTGKKTFIPRVNEMMLQRSKFNKRVLRKTDHIQLLLTDFAQFLLKEFKI